MATLVTRSGKGSPLTHAEVDANFTNLNTDKLELSGGTMTGNLSFGDNDKAIFGAGSDLQIYSDGTTGQIVGDVNITGTLTSDGLTVDGAIQVNATVPSLVLEETDTTDINGQVAVVSGITHIRTINDAGNSVTNRLSVNNSTGDISFYEDTGTTAKFFWDASAERLGIGDGTNTPPRTLHLKNDVPSIRLTDSTANDYAEIVSTDGDLFLRADHGNTHAGSRLRLQVDGTDALYIDDSLNVGIGTISPAAPLHIKGDTARFEDSAGNYFVGISYDSSGSFISQLNSTGHLTLSASTYGTLRFNTANSEAMRIDSSGSVGIGTTTPNGELQVLDNSSNCVVNFTSAAGSITALGLGDVDDLDNGAIWYSNADNSMRFYANAGERMRIDSSGNVLVGTTSTGVESSSSATGSTRYSSGIIGNGVSNNVCAVFNRQSSDGEIIRLRKDGTTVGSIGTSGGDLNIGTGDTGLGFADSLDSILPMTITGNTVRDNAIDIGYSIYRFKDLYLSGGVYLGGTGAANKLDDYEEGTSNPTLSGSTSGTKAGYGTYAKVGSLVLYQFSFDAIGSGLSGSLTFQVPFTNQASNNTAYIYFPVQAYNADWPSDAKALYGYLGYNSTTVSLHWSRDDNTSLSIQGSEVDAANCYIRGTIMYRTDS